MRKVKVGEFETPGHLEQEALRLVTVCVTHACDGSIQHDMY